MMFDASNRPEESEDPPEFHPAVLQLQDRPPPPLPRAVLHTLLALLAVLMLWATFGRIDIVVIAQGKLVPEGYVKIIQPTEAGVVREILVHDGERVKKEQPLMRLDAVASEADEKALLSDFHTGDLTLRRIDAELTGTALRKEPEDPGELFRQIEAQRLADDSAYADAVELEMHFLAQAKSDLAAAKEIHDKIKGILNFHAQELSAFQGLAEQEWVSRMQFMEKEREVLEQEQDLKAQAHGIRSAQEKVWQSQRRLASLKSDRRQRLQTERVEASARVERLRQELTKVQHRQNLLELRAPYDGTLKDIATHTVGTVVSPGTVLMTLVPQSGKLRAEIFISNQDIGFVTLGQSAKVKLEPYEFQKYGMLEGVVQYISADAVDDENQESSRSERLQQFAYRALVELSAEVLEKNGMRFPLAAGMRVNAEILLGRRSVLEYLLSPISRTVQEAGRER
jgi:HlyD family secretion protein